MSKHALVLLGALLLIAGIFLPMEGAPDSEFLYNLWDIDADNGVWVDGPGGYLLIIVIVTVLLVLMDRLEYVKVTGLLMFLIILNLSLGGWRYYYNVKLAGFGLGWVALWAGCILMAIPLWAEYFQRTPSGDDEPAREPGLAATAIDELSQSLDEPEDDSEAEDDTLEPLPRLNFRRKLHLIGLGVLLIGLFMPFYKESSHGITYLFGDNRVHGSLTYLLFVIILTMIMLAFDKVEYVWFLGLIMLGMIINEVRIIYGLLRNVEGSRFMWGWLVPLNGAAMLASSVFTDIDETERLRAVWGKIHTWWASFDPLAPFEEDEADSEDADRIGAGDDQVEVSEPED